MSISISFLVGAIWQVAIHQDFGAGRVSQLSQNIQTCPVIEKYFLFREELFGGFEPEKININMLLASLELH